MSQIDLDINRNVRRVMVRHWIDLGRIGIHSANGVVSIRGSLHVLPGVQTALTTKVISNLFVELRRVDNIRALQIEFDNWVEVDGSWQPFGNARGSGSISGQSGGSYTITEA